MKKVIVSAVSLLILCENLYTPAVAGQTSPTAQVPSIPFFKQGRIGLGIGAEYITSDTTLQIVPDITLFDIGINQSQISKKLVPAFYAEIGGMLTDDHYLGFLLSWRHVGAGNSARSPIRGGTYFTHDFRMNQYADFMLKPGYKVTRNIMAYALVGPSIANWTHTSNQFVTDSVVNKFRSSKTSIGLGIGLGAEYLVKKTYAFSLDYMYHFLPSSSSRSYMSYDYLERVAGGPPRLRTASGNILRKIQPSYSTIALRFTYFFNL